VFSSLFPPSEPFEVPEWTIRDPEDVRALQAGTVTAAGKLGLRLTVLSQNYGYSLEQVAPPFDVLHQQVCHEEERRKG
jgi:hypothetical protein